MNPYNLVGFQRVHVRSAHTDSAGVWFLVNGSSTQETVETIQSAVNAFETNEALIKELVEALSGVVSGDDAVHTALDDGPNVPTWDPTELRIAQQNMSEAVAYAKRVLANAEARS